MMASRKYIDQMLVHWGEDLLWEPTAVRQKRGSNVTPALLRPRGNGSSGGSGRADHVRDHLQNLVRRPPQVMVKITGGGADMKRIAAHLKYITRGGEYKKKGEEELAMQTDDGRIVSGKEARADVLTLFEMADAPIPKEINDQVNAESGQEPKRKRREALNVIFSMPHGINREAVKQAASATAKALFENHHYVLVHHGDTDHQHTHVLVKMAGHNGKRLNPRKADLENWRIEFAKQLNLRGIDAVASRRRVRLDRPKGEPQAKRQMRDRGVTPVHDTTAQTQPKARARAIEGAQKTAHAYAQMAKVLAESELSEDRKLAKEIQMYLVSKGQQPGAGLRRRGPGQDGSGGSHDPHRPRVS
jgi:hypothetical protein